MWGWLRQRPIRTGLIVFWLLFIPFQYFDSLLVYQFHIIRAISAAVGAGLVVAFARPFWQWFTTDVNLGPAHVFSAGIFLVWLGSLLHVLNNIGAQFTPDPPAFVHSIAGAASLWIATSGGIIMLGASEGIDHGTVVTRKSVKLGFFVAAAVLFAHFMTLSEHENNWWHSRPVVEWFSKLI